MSAFRTLASFLLSLALASSLAFPHGGGLDSCGGHHDRKRGGYHVHNQAKYCACNPKAAGCSSRSEPAPKPPPESKAEKPSSEKQETTVYVTRTGKKYHRDGCRYLRSSKIPMDLKEAAKKYGPCSVYNPPVPKAE